MATFKWTIEIEVAEPWITDGFNPDADAFHDAIYGAMLGYATPGEIKVKIVRQPTVAALEACAGKGTATDHTGDRSTY